MVGYRDYNRKTGCCTPGSLVDLLESVRFPPIKQRQIVEYPMIILWQQFTKLFCIQIFMPYYARRTVTAPSHRWLICFKGQLHLVKAARL